MFYRFQNFCLSFVLIDTIATWKQKKCEDFSVEHYTNAQKYIQFRKVLEKTNYVIDKMFTYYIQVMDYLIHE